MIPAAFDYHRSDTLDEALKLLKRHGDEAKVLSGGMSSCHAQAAPCVVRAPRRYRARSGARLIKEGKDSAHRGDDAAGHPRALRSHPEPSIPFSDAIR